MYQIYKTTQDIIRSDKKLNKALDKMGGTSFENIVRQTIDTFYYNKDSLGALCLADEFYWSKNKRLIFAESKELIHDVFDARYTLGKGATIDLPFDSFILSVPVNTFINGVKIVPSLVTYMRYGDYRDKYLQEVSSLSKNFKYMIFSTIYINTLF